MLWNRHHQALLGLFVISIAIAIAPAAQAADGTCGIDSLKGRYGFQASGRVEGPTKTKSGLDFSDKQTVHFAQMGTIDADGEGHALITMTSTSDRPKGSAVYTVNPDCTGTIRYLLGDPEADAAENGPGYAFVLKPDKTFSFISTITNMVLTGSAWQITDATNEPVPDGTANATGGAGGGGLLYAAAQCSLICPAGYWFYWGSGTCIPC
ncbi:hypothetical protein [Methylocaldum sp. GT1TLB]|jgi:hypothetical protein|uniref:hypothetical protein n=1 Tax=Methylocaldum sp. GT1TLB TaxID=3438965 RepID=UPI003DA15444